jgi:hypothetical protein
MKARFAAWTLMLALAGAPAALAQTAPLTPASPAAAPASKLPALDLSRLRRAGDFSDAESEALRTGVAKTAVDQRISEGLSGSLGFLCGLHPSVGDNGASAMRGVDPEGRFLGAKLSLAFR